MRSLSAPVIAALAAGEVALASLVKIDFPSGSIALNTSNYHLDWDGTTYQAAAGLGTIEPIVDTPSQLTALKLTIERADPTIIAVALDDADEVQGSLVTVSTAVLDATTHQIVDVLTEWVGYADTMTITENGETCSISLSAENKGVDLLRGSPLTYSDADQQTIASGDRYCECVVSQLDKPVVWPTREWFYR